MPASLTSARVVVVSTQACPYCKKAKSALAGAGIAYADVDVSVDQGLRTQVKEITGSRTVPQIFINGASIGGADALAAAMADGTFASALAKAATPALPPALLSAAQAAATAAADASASGAASTADADALRALASEMAATAVGGGGVARVADVAGRFTGRAAVDWLAATQGGDRETASARASALLRANLIAVAAYDDGSVPPASRPFADEPTALYAFVSELPLRPTAKGAPLNARFAWHRAARGATQVSTELRGLILELYEKHLSADGRAVSYKAMKDDPLFARYVNATAELQALDLAPLTTPELTALFINTYNALIVHALVVLGSPQGTLGRLEFFGAAKYIIGGQVYSADDMENGVLRGNAAPASSLWVLLGFPQLAKGQFSKRANDPRARKVVPKVDARIHFALVCGAKSCPPIKMYTPDNLDEGLQAAGEAFCASEVVVSRAINTVTLSKIFKWYAPDFGRTDTERLTWLAQFLQGQQRQDLDAMLASSNSSGSIKIKHKDYDWSLNGSE